MKNIHVLPTDKPSRLWMTKLGNLTRCHDIKPIKKALGNNVNIYITSDEEIKDCYYFNSKDNAVRKNNNSNHPYHHKIILTTNPDLIKDGVQPIPDEFLEWFIKNPNCEEVEVNQEFNPKNMVYGINTNPYKIIIPKEEPRYIMGFDPYDEPKQEALEDKLKSLVEEWRKRQLHYEEVAEDNITSEHNNRKFTYKAMATRDCWKELLKLIEDEK